MPHPRFAGGKSPLGQVLVERGLVTPEQVKKALAAQAERDQPLGRMLVELGFVEPGTMADVLAEMFRLPRANWNEADPPLDLIQSLPERVREEGEAFPFARRDGQLLLAMVDPLDVLLIDDLHRLLGLPIRPLMASHEEIRQAYNRALNLDDEAQRMLADIVVEEDEAEPEPEATGEPDSTGVRLFNALIARAVQERASDVHIEPRADSVRVRFRIDGLLGDVMTIPKKLQSDVLTRIKVVSGLDITERRRPQDGRVRVRVGRTEVDMRVSFLPSIHGEKAVIRLLPQVIDGVKSLAELGLLPEAEERVRVMLRQRQGLILLTGPTGSGKTTSLYSFLRELNKPEENIITIEDPVEYRLEGITQVQISARSGMTFADALRAVLRQDPNVVMVGEIRDHETAELAVRAALTGHLVVSTLHTNSAAGALPRLLDMGVEPFLLSATLLGVVAQRLVRALCPRCSAEQTEFEPAVRQFLGVGQEEPLAFKRGAGCAHCGGSGYRGRIMLEEVLVMSREMREAIGRETSERQLVAMAEQAGMTPLRECGVEKAKQGLTGIEEVMRALFSLEDLETAIATQSGAPSGPSATKEPPDV